MLQGDFRVEFSQNIHFFMKCWYFSELSCDKKNLKWIFISYSIYETSCVFYIPKPKARGYKTQNSFHKYRMKWKFISDPIFCILIRIKQIHFTQWNQRILWKFYEYFRICLHMHWNIELCWHGNYKECFDVHIHLSFKFINISKQCTWYIIKLSYISQPSEDFTK